MAGAIIRTGPERRTMLAVLGLGAVGGLLGLLAPPSTGVHGDAEQLLDVLRVVSTAALVLSVLLGPGIAWRSLSGRRDAGLAFLPLPGLALLVGTGILAWLLSGEVEPETTCAAVVWPTLGLLLGCLLASGPEELLDAAERRCLLIVGAILGLALARALWSPGPEGELYGESISRTLEVGNRSDSRIPFILPQLVAHGEAPYGHLASTFFAPYNFSSRGPLAGLGTTPIVLMAGANPPDSFADHPWRPFDPQGFMAFRVAMMAMAATAFVSLWDLTRRLMGDGAARLALLLAAATPFLIHEVWFTWPKLLAASFVLLAGICVIERRPLPAGLLMGAGYLMHPVALISLPAILLLAAWPLRGASWRRPRLRPLLALGAGLSVFLVGWRLGNGDRFTQNEFVEYLTQAEFNLSPSPWEWLVFRIESVANTVVPMLLPFSSDGSIWINQVGGFSPASIHLLIQYWTTVPFGMAIVFFGLLLASLWRAGRRWPWPVLATVAIPFLAFAVYWGATPTGMMREGLQAWALTLVVVVACQQAAAGFPWLRSGPIRLLLSLRPAEVLAMAIGPALATEGVLIGAGYPVSDTIALLAMLLIGAALALLTWSATPAELEGVPEPGADLSAAATRAPEQPPAAPGSRPG